MYNNISKYLFSFTEYAQCVLSKSFQFICASWWTPVSHSINKTHDNFQLTLSYPNLSSNLYFVSYIFLYCRQWVFLLSAEHQRQLGPSSVGGKKKNVKLFRTRHLIYPKLHIGMCRTRQNSRLNGENNRIMKRESSITLSSQYKSLKTNS